jgi:gamma-glutamylcyclotransferase (GGCT)/AIG2-like uncharacterized protein YtfP
MLYFAYGMNTNRRGMTQRCPGALSLGHARLIDYSFRFATHADVVKCKGSYVDGVLWTIDDFHLNSLDHLEGYPYYYNRRALRVAHEDRVVMAETYFMQPGNLDAWPSQGYFDMVVEGYREHNVPTEQLFNSVYESTTFLKG